MHARDGRVIECRDDVKSNVLLTVKPTKRIGHMRKLGLLWTLAISIGAATSAFSQSAAPTVDPAWKAPEVVEFIGLKKGDKVADIVGGSSYRIACTGCVGPSGKVYAVF